MSGKLPKEMKVNLARALSGAQEFVALIDHRGNIQWINDTLSKKRGLVQKDIIGKNFGFLFDPNLGDLAPEILIAVINDGCFNGELLMSSRDGSFPALVMASYIPPEKEGADFQILFIAHDRSLEKPKEDEARRRREFLSRIIKRAPLGIFCMDLNGEITIVNDFLREIIGRADMEIKTGDSISKLKEMLNPELITMIEAAMEGRHADYGDIPLLVGDHPRPVVNVMASPILSPDGVMEGIVVILEDRTEKVRIAEKLRQTDRLSSLGFLAAGVAHEVNNPLAGIIGIMGLVRKDATAKGVDDEPFERISTNLKRIENIVKSLLDFGRIKINVIRDFDINEVVEKTSGFFRMQPRFRWIKIETDLSGEIPNVRGDPNQIEQVLQDLMINSVQAIENEGEITLSTDYDPLAREALVRVKDSGCGISRQHQDKIFEPFFTTKEPGQGTGLGLAVSYTIVHQHGGTISVEETSPKGTTFVIRLPISRESGKTSNIQ